MLARDDVARALDRDARWRSDVQHAASASGVARLRTRSPRRAVGGARSAARTPCVVIGVSGCRVAARAAFAVCPGCRRGRLHATRADADCSRGGGWVWSPIQPDASTTPTPEPRAPSTVVLISGPEGGLAPTEREQLVRVGFLPIGLGPRVLRAETAPVAAIAVIRALTYS